MSVMNHKHTFETGTGGQQQSGDTGIDFWAFNPTSGHLDVHASLASAAQAAGAGGVSFVVGRSRAATPAFLRLCGRFAEMMERDLSADARIQRAELVTRWRYSSEAKKRAWAKEEGIEFNQLERRVQRAEAAQGGVVVTGVEFAFGIAGRPVARVHHGYWRGKYDVLSEVFAHIKGVYTNAKTPAPTTATTTDSTTAAPADTTTSTTDIPDF